jgi:hypothetical protein
VLNQESHRVPGVVSGVKASEETNGPGTAPTGVGSTIVEPTLEGLACSGP